MHHSVLHVLPVILLPLLYLYYAFSYYYSSHYGQQNATRYKKRHAKKYLVRTKRQYSVDQGDEASGLAWKGGFYDFANSVLHSFSKVMDVGICHVAPIGLAVIVREDDLPVDMLLVQIMKVPFCIPTPGSRRIAATYNIIDNSLTPPCAFHGFIRIKNFTFEYGNQGLAKSEVPYVGPRSEEVHREETRRTLPEIYQWFYSTETREKFGADKYNLSTNNCLVFVKRMCDFLQIKYPIVFHEILTCLEAAENANNQRAIWTWTGYGMLLVSYGLIQMGNNTSESPYTLRNFGVNCFVPILGTAGFVIHHWVTRNPIFLVLLFFLFVFYTYPIIFLY